MAEAIQATIAQLAIPHPASPIAAVVTVSFGLASTIPAPGADANQFIARADQALYRAKQQGRTASAAADGLKAQGKDRARSRLGLDGDDAVMQAHHLA